MEFDINSVGKYKLQNSNERNGHFTFCIRATQSEIKYFQQREREQLKIQQQKVKALKRSKCIPSCLSSYIKGRLQQIFCIRFIFCTKSTLELFVRFEISLKKPFFKLETKYFFLLYFASAFTFKQLFCLYLRNLHHNFIIFLFN